MPFKVCYQTTTETEVTIVLHHSLLGHSLFTPPTLSLAIIAPSLELMGLTCLCPLIASFYYLLKTNKQTKKESQFFQKKPQKTFLPA